MLLGEAWGWIERRQRFGVHPGLERTRALLRALGDPQDALAVALIAGTNGKGSTTALLDAMLRALPEPRGSVGRFTSPHLLRFDERFWIDGRPVAPAALLATLAEVRPVAERLEATFFEVLVALALLLFARAGVGRAVLEVGMGGRLDATNATEPALSAITQIALDHEGVLGSGLEAIAGEKAGILRPGVPAITSADGAALAVVRRRSAQVGAPLVVVDEVGARMVDLGWEGVEVHGLGPVPVRAPLLGGHQARNLAVAVLAARAWGVPWAAIVEGARQATWPGRLEPIEGGGIRWLLDGAHNPAGAAALIGALGRLGVRPSVAVIGVTEERIDGGLVPALAELAPILVVTRAVWSPRSAAPERLAAGLMSSGVDAGRIRVAASPLVAVRLAADLAGDGGVPGPEGEGGPHTAGARATIAVAGSLYLVAEVRALLVGEEVERFERWQ